ncbi:fructosamine kinase PKL/CAK/FruK [Dendrothele bispora CBS 962.96]|uniref:protein-ribulosamine 3-kinase n=1 Tax=Dendrothele bispora (strain CBS 962.96) TaxID=1314807 RepID=A0A4S8MW65_DENBC|nr:fructosamine kinase PKL/CAK/FruK [Dendrothele bispora CBS 962.96]
MAWSIPQVLLDQLRQIEKSSDFTVSGSTVRSSSGRAYFVKLGTSRDREQYAGEAESLRSIDAAAPKLAPKLYASGVSEDGKPYFISEFKEMGAYLHDEAAVALAKRMATELHKYQSPNHKFGFSIPTYCGATRLENGWYDTWQECFSTLIGNLLRQFRRQGGSGYEEICTKGEQIRERVIPKLLGPLDIHPALLHGDLWSGNVGVERSTGNPVIYDPSSYYGHNEADLAIARIFGGFPPSFYEAYHQNFPKAEPVDQYELRAELYELFHYLNHTVLFGGSYGRTALRIIDRLLDAKL